MRKAIATCAAGALLLAGAATATASPGNGNHNGAGNGNGGSSEAAKLCAAQKKADRAAFKAVWGKHAMRECIRANRGTTTEPVTGAEEFQNAADQCRDEQAADPEAFTATYGTNHNGRNAFGKCVSAHVGGEDEEGTS